MAGCKKNSERAARCAFSPARAHEARWPAPLALHNDQLSLPAALRRDSMRRQHTGATAACLRCTQTAASAPLKRLPLPACSPSHVTQTPGPLDRSATDPTPTTLLPDAFRCDIATLHCAAPDRQDMDMAAAPVELSRREREAVEAQRKKDHYMKLHAEGKTQEAQVCGTGVLAESLTRYCCCSMRVV